MVRRVASFTNHWVAFLCVAALGCAVPASAAAAEPALPARLVPEDATPYLRTHALGTQNYICLATGSGLAWRFVAPEATLFVPLFGFPQQVTTHFFSPNPEEGNLTRATWQASFDSSRVWARATQVVDDVATIGAGNIPWLLLQRAGSSRGPTGGSLLSQASFVQRIHTSGGVAPATGCSQSTDVGALALVPYSAEYVFLH
jgi:hypothetical protein